MTERTKKKLTILGFVIFIVLMAAVTYFVGKPLVQYARNPELFREWIGAYGIWSRVVFVGTVFLQTVVAFIPGEPFEIVAGYAFGAFWGTAFCVIGELLGSIAVFLFVRKFGMKAVEVFFPREKIDSLKFLQNEKKLETFTFFVFLMPGTPKDLLCYFVGMTHMRLSVWLLISSVGRFPSVITSTLGGNALGLGQNGFAIIVFVVTFIISIVGLLGYNRFTKIRAQRYEVEQRQLKKARKQQKRIQKANRAPKGKRRRSVSRPHMTTLMTDKQKIAE